MTSLQGAEEIQTKQLVTVCAFIHRSFDGVEKVFVPKRARTKKFLPDVFELPGGHVHFNEEPVDALKREILEEFGMQIAVGDPFYVFAYANHDKVSHSIEVIYFAVFDDPTQQVRLDPAEHSEYLWISRDEMDRIVSKEKNEDDHEMRAIKKGFDVLHGSRVITR